MRISFVYIVQLCYEKKHSVYIPGLHVTAQKIYTETVPMF